MRHDNLTRVLATLSLGACAGLLTACGGARPAATPARHQQATGSQPTPPAQPHRAAVSAQTAPQNSASMSNPCGLLPASVASQAIGGMTKPPMSGASMFCSYYTRIPGIGTVFFNLGIRSRQFYDLTKGYYNHVVAIGKGHTEPVPALGDGSFATDVPPNYQVSAVRGGKAVVVAVPSMTAAARQRANALAAAAIARL